MQKFVCVLAINALVWVLAGCAQESAPTETGAPAAAPEINELLSQGDPEAGRRIYIYCQSCHSINEGGSNKVGPNLYGIYAAAAAGVDGFVYSEALSSSGVVWDDVALDQWVARPGVLVPGTTMLFAGVRDKQQRADLIAYMKQNSPSSGDIR